MGTGSGRHRSVTRHRLALRLLPVAVAFGALALPSSALGQSTRYAASATLTHTVKVKPKRKRK